MICKTPLPCPHIIHQWYQIMQKKGLVSVIKQAHLAQEIPAFDVAYQLVITQLDKKCCTLCITLLDHQLYESEYESAVVSFLAVWGIDFKGGTFRDVQNFTKDLSAFVK